MDINFFENSYEYDAAAPLRTPDSSTPGALPKRWEYKAEKSILFKGSSTAEEREPYKNRKILILLQPL